MSDSLPFGPWLKQRRRELDLTQAELARQATCATESIRKIESGALKPSRLLALQIAQVLRVPTAEHEPFVTFARSSQQMAPADAFRAHPYQAPSPTSAPPAVPLYTLPRPLTSFVGRAREVEAVVRLLQRPEVALVTLSGPPGAGKTRLSLAAGQRLHGDFPDGVCFVPLATVGAAHMLLPAIAQALGVQETPNSPLMLTLKRNLRDRRLLLVLDNFEQLVAAAPLLSELLTAAAHVKTLITSRSVLKVYGEHEFPLGPLALPASEPLPSLESLLSHSAVQLFVERAGAVRPGFTLRTDNAKAIAQICIALDGLPLAIEMAAARIKWSGPDAVLQQLRRQLSKLAIDARDLPPRQRTLRGAIDWSYDLLESGERRALTWLSVFVGGCTLEAARAILGDAHVAVTLEALVEKSLLHHELDSGGDVRFMQLEMIRDYARAKLNDANELRQASDRHLAYFVGWAEAAAPLLLGAEQATWYDRLETDHDNLRAAAQWARDGGQPIAGLRLASATWEFWIARGHQAEWLERLNDLLSLPQAAAHDGASAQARVRGLNTAAFTQWHQGYPAAARKSLEEAFKLARARGDQHSLAIALRYQGLVSISEGDVDGARTCFEQSLGIMRRLDDRYQLGWSLAMLADLALRRNDEAQARPLYSESAMLLRAHGNKTLLAYVVRRLGQLAMRAADVLAAARLYAESLSLNQGVNDRRSMAACLVGLASVAAAQSRTADAVHLLAAATMLLDRLSAALLPADQAEYERSLNALRSSLDATAFDAAWREGAALTFQDAVARALTSSQFAGHAPNA